MDKVLDSWKKTQKFCTECDHLDSLHANEGCNTWLLGVAKVPLYKCSCIGIGTAFTTYASDNNSVINNPSQQPTINIKSITAIDLPTLRLELDKVNNELREMSDELDRALQALKEQRSRE